MDDNIPDEIMLGSDVEDTVTGFAGVLTAVAHYLTNEVLGLVESNKDKRWINLSRLKEL